MRACWQCSEYRNETKGNVGEDPDLKHVRSSGSNLRYAVHSATRLKGSTHTQSARRYDRDVVPIHRNSLQTPQPLPNPTPGTRCLILSAHSAHSAHLLAAAACPFQIQLRARLVPRSHHHSGAPHSKPLQLHRLLDSVSFHPPRPLPYCPLQPVSGARQFVRDVYCLPTGSAYASSLREPAWSFTEPAGGRNKICRPPRRRRGKWRKVNNRHKKSPSKAQVKVPWTLRIHKGKELRSKSRSRTDGSR